MKVKIVLLEILVPEHWTKQDVVIACNASLSKWGESQPCLGKLSGLDYNATALAEYKLERPE